MALGSAVSKTDIKSKNRRTGCFFHTRTDKGHQDTNSAQLNVMFGPLPRYEIDTDIFVHGQAGDIEISFNASLAPVQAYWLLENNVTLPVPISGVNYDHADFEVHAINGCGTTFTALLHLKTITEQVVGKIKGLAVKSALNEEFYEYTATEVFYPLGFGGHWILAVILVFMAFGLIVFLCLIQVCRSCYEDRKRAEIEAELQLFVVSVNNVHSSNNL